MTQHSSQSTDQIVKTVAAIDIGANSVRMVIAQVFPDGRIETLENLRRALRLGQEVFQRGKLSRQAMNSAISILRDYRKLIDFYDVSLIRAVATSAVRESANCDTFIDRVLMSTGLDIEVIDTSEESRLSVSAVSQAASQVVGRKSTLTMVCDVGGGSTLMTLMKKGEITHSQSLTLGSIRIQELSGTTNEAPARAAGILQKQIDNVIEVVKTSFPIEKVRNFVAIGGDARFAAKQIGKPTKSKELMAVSASELNKLVKKCSKLPSEELASRFKLSYDDAETVTPALMVYRSMLRATGAKEMLVSQVSMRQGLLLDLARIVTGQEDQSFNKNVLHSANAIAEKYRVNMDHAHQVAKLSVGLFDQLINEHRLTTRHRLLLEAAAILHEVGGFISSRAHHKHSYYLISNSEIFGLTREEIEIVAQVARYHRRSVPKASHISFGLLTREMRIVISKLAALLRVADSLDRAHSQQVKDFRIDSEDGDLVIYIPGVADLSLERRALMSKGDLFSDIYCMKIRLEESQLIKENAIKAGVDERG